LVAQDAIKKKKPMIMISGRADFFLKRVFLGKVGCGIIILSSDEKLMVHKSVFVHSSRHSLC
jgi:hypothetical protein